MLYPKLLHKHMTYLHKILKKVTSPIKPVAIIVGAQKSGTTALWNYLAKHPKVKPSLVKEIDFFVRDESYTQGDKYYHSFFPPKLPNRRSMVSFDVSPSYLASKERSEICAQRIHAYNPSLKIIAILREPVSRAYSAWNMYRNFYKSRKDWFYNWMRWLDGQEYPELKKIYVPRHEKFGQDFYKDMQQEIEVIEQGKMIEAPILEYGFYYQNLKPYLELFSQQQMLLLSNEAMSKDKVKVLKQIEEFTGLSSHAWHKEKLEREFAGTYKKQNKLDLEPAFNLLKQYYQKHNLELFEKCNLDFSWDY